MLAFALLGARCTAPSLPDLVASDPSAGGLVPRGHWPVLSFAVPFDPAALEFVLLVCNGSLVDIDVHVLGADRAVVNPAGVLPAGASCELALPAAGGATKVPFTTRAASAAATATYDRRDRNQPLPFPDDAFLAPDASTATGWRPDVEVPDHDATVEGLLTAMADVAAEGDGWSPVGSIALHFDAALDPASLPRTEEASLDPLATIQLLDLTPGSASAGQRVPFTLVVRSDSVAGAPVSHDLVLFPAIPLEPEGRYGLAVTNRVRAASGAPLARSAFFDAVATPAVAGEAPEVAAVRPLAADVLAAAAQAAPVPVPPDDVALALRLTIRSTDAFSQDVLDMRDDVVSQPPNVQIASVTPWFFGALVEGTFDTPVWRTGPFLARDGAGRVQQVGTASLPFVLVLPSLVQGAPIVMYQHGNPGSAENEVPSAAFEFLGPAGFAVAGFTDVLNRTYATVDDQNLALFGVLLVSGDLPDFYLQTIGEQLAFLEALKSMGSLDVKPVGAPDGVPDLDPTRIVFEGISFGAFFGQGFLPYAPDVRGGALVAGSGRLVKLIEYQDRTLPSGGTPLLTGTVPQYVRNARAVDIFMGLGLLASIFDPQEPHNHARFLTRAPFAVGGTLQKPSVLVAEGIGDTFISNAATRSLAWQIGAELLEPAPVPVSYLDTAFPPVQGNVGATTAALQQFVPSSAPLPPTPGCEFEPEGHFCAQTAPGARAQRVAFYQSAVDGGVPAIDAPPP